MESSSKALHSLVSTGTQWSGPDAERFRSQWQGQSSKQLAAAVDALNRAAEVLKKNADQQEQASSASEGTRPGTTGAKAPSGAAGLFEHIQNGDKTDDGFRIEKVVGPDGQTRLIVYFKGQDTTPGRGLDRSIGLATGVIGLDPVAQRALDAALADSPNGKRTEVMMVGLSQGGMDAQNFAASGKYNVTTLVTYGSPIIQTDDPNIQTVHIQAVGDPVPAAGEAAEIGANALKGKYSIPVVGPILYTADMVENMAPANTFSFDPHDGVGMQVHERDYPAAAHAFDNSADAQFDDVKQSMKKFEGTETVIVN